jgi:hypothetical protein
MNKAQQYSLMRIEQAIAVIEELAPKEEKREAIQRRRQMERAYESMTLHADKLDIEVPELSTFYYPEQYLKHARLVGALLKERKLSGRPEQSRDVQQHSLWDKDASEVN